MDIHNRETDETGTLIEVVNNQCRHPYFLVAVDYDGAEGVCVLWDFSVCSLVREKSILEDLMSQGILMRQAREHLNSIAREKME